MASSMSLSSSSSSPSRSRADALRARAAAMLRGMAFVLSCALLSSACQTIIEPEPGPVTREVAQRTRAATVTTVEISGRVGVREEQTFSADFHFYNDGKEIKLEMISPLGSSLGKITVSGDRATLAVNDREYTAQTLTRLIYDLYGITMPFDHLNDILMARVDEVTLEDGNGLVIKGVYAGYEINYAEYKTYNSLALPTNISLKAGRAFIRIKINQVYSLK